MKSILYLGTIFSILSLSAVAKAQDSSAGSTPDTTNNPQIQINQSQTVRQPGTVLDSNSGSRQFFQQGRDRLYFLPEEKSEPVLEVDEELESETQESKPQTEVIQDRE